MKRGELERRRRALGWFFLRSGGKHDVWAHPVKTHHLYVPGHPVIAPGTARRILKDAER